MFGTSVQAQFHGAAIFKTPVGPDMVTPTAGTGQLVTAIITVMNMDEAGDSITITNIFDTVHHSSGDSVSSNLVTAPVTLSSFIAIPAGGTDTLVVTNVYKVLPGDENLPLGILPDDAHVEGADNHDSLAGGTFIKQGFFLTYPGQIMVTTNVTGCPGPTNCAFGAWSDPTYRPANKPPDRNQAFWARGISTNLVFYPNPGSWTENPDGTAQLSGVLRSLTNLGSGFVVSMNLSGRTSTPPAHSPTLELAPNAYLQNGGPIDPSKWYFYNSFTGTLSGFGFWQGALISIKPDSASGAFQVGIGANGKNTRFGATGWWNWKVLQQPLSNTLSSQTIVANINLDLLCCAPSTIGDLVWQDLNKNGIQDAGEPGVPNVQVRLWDCANAVVLATTTTGPGGQYLFGNLVAGGYAVQFIPPSSYQFTKPYQGSDPALDSNANPTNGFTECIALGSNQMNLTIDAGLISNCVPACVIAAFSDPTYRPASKPPGRNQALWMKGISTNLIFSPNPGSWIENSDGTAQLTGTLRSLTNTTSGFTIVLNFSGRTTTVLSGSPKLELDPSAYVGNGGPLDPSTWYYYANISGTLAGFGFWQGAALNLAPVGPAFQVGVGANGKNQNYGGSGWFNWTVTHQPTSSGSLPTTGQGDLNVDFICCP